jgi:F0F1-type ATP synthase membrane subunit b/b'
MNAIFYKPILSIIRKREDYISSNYEDSKRFDETAKEYQDTHDSKIDQTQRECRHEFKKAIGEAHNVANSQISEAKDNSKRVIREKKDLLYKDCENLKTEVKTSVVNDLAGAVIDKLMGTNSNLEVKD